MNIFQAVILGIIQGIAEFLPISSSGHLVLFNKLFGVKEPSMTFDIILHIGTLIPVLIVYRSEILDLIKKPFQKTTYLLVVATIPTVVFAVLFNDAIGKLFETGKYLSVGFILTGTFLLYADKSKEGRKKSPSYLDALLIGVMQAIAIIPAVSRSGSTIAGALRRGLTRADAAKFSFLMSIPAIVGATVYEFKDIVTGEVSLEAIPFLPTLFGFAASILAGYLSINLLISVISKAKLQYFAYYVYTLAGLILLDQFIFHIFF